MATVKEPDNWYKETFSFDELMAEMTDGTAEHNADFRLKERLGLYYHYVPKDEKWYELRDQLAKVISTLITYESEEEIHQARYWVESFMRIKVDPLKEQYQDKLDHEMEEKMVDAISWQDIATE